MSDSIAGILSIVVTVIVLGMLDIYAFWPVLAAIAGGWAVILMAAVLVVEGVGITGELKALA